jgi:hypothetical protein
LAGCSTVLSTSKALKGGGKMIVVSLDVVRLALQIALILVEIRFLLKSEKKE